MQLINLHLQQFRNYTNEHLSPGKECNILLGDNAQGKSSLLESIGYLCFGNSPRGVNDIHVVGWEAPFFVLEAEIQCQQGVLALKIAYDKIKGKKFFINHVAQDRFSNGVGVFQTVWFAPEHLALVKGPPVGRRNFLDMHIYRLVPRARSMMQKYRQLILQRNHLLRQARSSVTSTYQLDVWDEQLVEVGAYLLYLRLQTIGQMKELAYQAHSRYSQGTENLQIDYLSSLEINDQQAELVRIKPAFQARLKESRKQDIQKGVTLVGPHRDDLVLKINGMDARFYGSQGQQRTIALSLKMAERELVRIATGEYPVLLLDDVLSELDVHRREKLLQDINDSTQCFVSTSTMEGLSVAALHNTTVINVAAGSLTMKNSH